MPLLTGVAYISGAASGIGKSTAISFASNGVTHLALADINGSLLASTATALQSQFPHVKILPLEMDISNEESIVRGVSRVVEEFGRIDYAVNNAGVSVVKESVAMNSEECRKVIDVNLFGVWVSQREQIRWMLKQEPLPSESGRRDRGVIVNTASMLGVVGAPGQTPCTPYVATKHGVIGLTKSDTISYAGQGIRINGICPGFIETPILFETGAKLMVQKQLANVPLGRFGRPEEASILLFPHLISLPTHPRAKPIAESIVFLASPMSSYIHGTALIVDGGFTAA